MTTQDRPLRVALVSETFLPKLDGVTTVMCLLMDHLRKSGAEAILFSGGKHVESYQGYPVVSITPSIPMPMYPEIKMSLPRRVHFRALQEFDPDILHIANPMHTGIRFVWFGRRLNKPVAMSFHTHIMEMAKFYHLGFLQRPLWYIHRIVYKRADYRWATSKRVQAELIEHGFGPTGLWRRGVDSSVFSPHQQQEQMRMRLTGGQPDKTLLLFVGRVAPEKQIGQIKHVLDAIPNTHLAIVGDGPHREKLERHFNGAPVTFAGYLKGKELSAAYSASDVFVFPSAIETFGLVVAEAMATGLPVVSSRVGGVPEIIETGHNGYIFEPNDIDQMITYVQELVENPQKRQEMGQKGMAAIQHLTWPVIMDELIEDYRQIIENHQAKLQQ
ncbi:MAG: glycosyltransferase family 1 protein [Chloroflexi bacterium]|nr:glycosyltransferase family 1 protein [Chloroflexota bacterium]